jgi:glycosyltransferase involved in cell wall biosynthesis
MRILFVIDEMTAITAGGTERQILQMAQIVKEAGFDIHIGVLRGSDWLRSATGGIGVTVFDIQSVFRPQSYAKYRRVIRWIQKEKYTLVQSHFRDSNIIIPLIAWLARVPMIISTRRNLNHGTSPLEFLVQRAANLFASRILVNCEAVKRVVVSTEKYNPEKIDVLYNVLETDRFAFDEAARRHTRERLQLGPEQIVIGMVSGLRPEKGVETFIRAAAAVKQACNDPAFLLVGDGTMEGYFRDMVESLGISPAFIFAGAQENVTPFLNAMDIAVLSSDVEGFSNSLLEYMAAGLACVATDVGGNGEALAGAGILVPRGDAACLAEQIIRLARDRDLRQALGEAALRRAQEFDYPHTSARIVSYYQALAAELHSRRRPQT